MIDVAAMRQAFVLGIAKSPTANPLVELSLLAAHGKFLHPVPPSGRAEPAPPLPKSAHYLSDESRAILGRLFSGKDAGVSDGIASAVARTLRQTGLRLHPFDYARLETFIASYSKEMGPEERAWLRIIRPERNEPDEPYGDGPLTEDILPQVSKAQKLQFLRALRVSDRAAALQLIETLAPDEPANIRAEMIGLLAVGLSEEDKPLLESAAQDRAQSVRDAASGLLARMRGTEAFTKRMDRLKDHLKIATAGLLRRHKVLKLQTANDEETVRTLLQGLNLEDVGLALGETPETLLQAASQSEKLGSVPLLLLLQAVKEQRFELAERHKALLDGVSLVDLIAFLENALPVVERASHERILRIVLRPNLWHAAQDIAIASGLAELINGPLPTDIASAVMDSPPMASAPERAVAAISPLIPHSLSSRFLGAFEDASRRAALYHRFLLSLPNLPT